MEKLLTKLAGLQSENDELGVENAALAAALLHDESVVLLRRMNQGQGQHKGQGPGPGKGSGSQGGHGVVGYESQSNLLGQQYQQRQQRDRKVATHPTNTPYQYTLSTHPINPPYQHTI